MERSRGEEIATHSSVLSWKILWTEEPGGLQSIGLQESHTTQQLNHHHDEINLFQAKRHLQTSLFFNPSDLRNREKSQKSCQIKGQVFHLVSGMKLNIYVFGKKPGETQVKIYMMPYSQSSILKLSHLIALRQVACLYRNESFEEPRGRPLKGYMETERPS